MGGRKPDKGPTGGPSNAYAAVYPRVIIVSAELVTDSVMVTVAVVILVIVEYRSIVLVGTVFQDGMKYRPTTRASRQTVVSVRTSCRFMRRVQQSSIPPRHNPQN